MAIKINNYESWYGVVLKEVTLRVTEITLYPLDEKMAFSASIFLGDTDRIIESGVIYGELNWNAEMTNLEDIIYDAIEEKIDNVIDKTDEECDEHNMNVNKWIDVWDKTYLKFVSGEGSDDDEDYIEAARILLGE